MAPPTRPNQQQTYQETPDWATAFVRPDNQPPQPGATGDGVLSAETLDEIRRADGAFRLALWTKDNQGKPLRNRDGSLRIRVHIEPPYQENGAGAGNSVDPADDDIPF